MVESRQDGRFIYYTANYDQMNGLLSYLTENCCQGQGCAAADCAPMAQPKRWAELPGSCAHSTLPGRIACWFRAPLHASL